LEVRTLDREGTGISIVEDSKIDRGFDLQDNSTGNHFTDVIECGRHEIEPVVASEPLNSESFEKDSKFDIVDAQVRQNVFAGSSLALAFRFLLMHRTRIAPLTLAKWSADLPLWHVGLM
jgi:hypothetical protein